MSMVKSCIVALCVAAGLSSITAKAAVLNLDLFGEVLSVEVLDVNGTLYDVTFQRESGARLTPADVSFQTASEASLAAGALADFLNDNGAPRIGAIEEIDPQLRSSFAVIFPLFGAPTEVASINYLKDGALAGVFTGDYVRVPDFVDLRFQAINVATFVESNVSQVPLPAAGWMLFAGLGAFGLMRTTWFRRGRPGA
jgi:hypothetical protein